MNLKGKHMIGIKRLVLFSLFFITCILSSSLHASYAYSTESDGLTWAFEELRFLFELYKDSKGVFPVDDAISSGMAKLALFTHELDVSSKSINCPSDPYRPAAQGLKRVLGHCLWRADNRELIYIEILGTGDTHAVLRDPWGTPIVILIPGKEHSVDFYSLGKKRMDKTKNL